MVAAQTGFTEGSALQLVGDSEERHVLNIVSSGSWMAVRFRS
jgi:hypothetical protein